MQSDRAQPANCTRGHPYQARQIALAKDGLCTAWSDNRRTEIPTSLRNQNAPFQGCLCHG
jgi:hypothetical protein